MKAERTIRPELDLERFQPDSTPRKAACRAKHPWLPSLVPPQPPTRRARKAALTGATPRHRACFSATVRRNTHPPSAPLRDWLLPLHGSACGATSSASRKAALPAWGDFTPFGRAIVCVKEKRVGLNLFQQNHADIWQTVRIDSGECDGIGIVRFCRFRRCQPSRAIANGSVPPNIPVLSLIGTTLRMYISRLQPDRPPPAQTVPCP